MSDHIEQPESDDVEGHFQVIDGEGRATAPAPTRLPVTDDDDDVEGHFQVIDGEGRATAPAPTRLPVTDDDDVEGHVLDLDIERKR